MLALGGDGDAFAIGGGHFVHAARRNLNICYVVMDNNIYGLTKGQTSPTSQVGFVTKTTPKGSPDRSISPLTLGLAPERRSSHGVSPAVRRSWRS